MLLLEVSNFGGVAGKNVVLMAISNTNGSPNHVDICPGNGWMVEFMYVTRIRAWRFNATLQVRSFEFVMHDSKSIYTFWIAYWWTQFACAKEYNGNYAITIGLEMKSCCFDFPSYAIFSFLFISFHFGQHVKKKLDLAQILTNRLTSFTWPSVFNKDVSVNRLCYPENCVNVKNWGKLVKIDDTLNGWWRVNLKHFTHTHIPHIVYTNLE